MKNRRTRRASVDDYDAAEMALRAQERESDVLVDVHQDSSNVWWVADVTYQATGRSVPRAADEGGTNAHYSLARAEGLARAKRASRGGKLPIVEVVRPTPSPC